MMFFRLSKEKIKKNTTIPLSEKTRKIFDSIIKHLEDFINKNHRKKMSLLMN